MKALAITYSVLISHCFALHPYEKHELIKTEWVITDRHTHKHTLDPFILYPQLLMQGVIIVVIEWISYVDPPSIILNFQQPDSLQLPRNEDIARHIIPSSCTWYPLILAHIPLFMTCVIILLHFAWQHEGTTWHASTEQLFYFMINDLNVIWLFHVFSLYRFVEYFEYWAL